MWTNGSRAALLTPANARTTGNPSPSWPRGPVVTVRTGRSVSTGPAADIRGKVRVSAVIAGIGLLLTWIPDITGLRSDYSVMIAGTGSAPAVGGLRRPFFAGGTLVNQRS